MIAFVAWRAPRPTAPPPDAVSSGSRSKFRCWLPPARTRPTIMPVVPHMVSPSWPHYRRLLREMLHRERMGPATEDQTLSACMIAPHSLTTHVASNTLPSSCGRGAPHAWPPPHAWHEAVHACNAALHACNAALHALAARATRRCTRTRRAQRDDARVQRLVARANAIRIRLMTCTSSF